MFRLPGPRRPLVSQASSVVLVAVVAVDDELEPLLLLEELELLLELELDGHLSSSPGGSRTGWWSRSHGGFVVPLLVLPVLPVPLVPLVVPPLPPHFFWIPMPAGKLTK